LAGSTERKFFYDFMGLRGSNEQSGNNIARLARIIRRKEARKERVTKKKWIVNVPKQVFVTTKEPGWATYHVEVSWLGRKSLVTMSTMKANVVEQAIQHPGPMAKANMVITPIRDKIPKKAHWLAFWRGDPSLARARQALETPMICAPIKSHKIAGESNPFIRGRFLSVCVHDTLSWMDQK
jgi:hypothetical protein